ncbi:hypothetical protein [Colwellia psychrerythraea]|uniref:Lipoprotein n=1 Tax=Colwellia psychrerythraea TaxID=28229 RepID=A0A099KMC3_COLPS|nr:hypothetical protein [Colwellia psychrerythraea]KGJ91914.1 hypothetical protein GAB14E_3071 [Colwellia psychrerythraea]
MKEQSNTKRPIKLKKLILSFLVLLSISCSTTQPETLENNNTTQFFVTPTELTINDDLTINLPKLRPKNLAIVDSNGQFFIIQSVEAGVLMMPEEEFSLMKVLEIPIKNTKGTIWINGQKSEQVIFEKAGKYKVYFADNLETEPENTFNFSAHITVK